MTELAGLFGLGGWRLYGPVVLALAAACGAGLAGRRGVVLPAAALGAVVGWMALSPGVGRWWSLREGVSALVAPGVGFFVAGLIGTRVRGRWVGIAALWFAAWWLAWSLGGRTEFWRVLFGAVVAGWVLRRVGAEAPQRATVVAATVAAGLVLGGMWGGGAGGTWVLASGVLVAACAGAWAGGDRVVPAGLVMVGLVGAELAGGRLARGAVGTVDLACLASLGAPAVLPWVEGAVRRRLGQRRSGRWLGGIAGGIAVVVVAVGAGLAAWVASRALRG